MWKNLWYVGMVRGSPFPQVGQGTEMGSWRVRKKEDTVTVGTKLWLSLVTLKVYCSDPHRAASFSLWWSVWRTPKTKLIWRVHEVYCPLKFDFEQTISRYHRQGVVKSSPNSPFFLLPSVTSPPQVTIISSWTLFLIQILEQAYEMLFPPSFLMQWKPY